MAEVQGVSISEWRRPYGEPEAKVSSYMQEPLVYITFLNWRSTADPSEIALKRPNITLLIRLTLLVKSVLPNYAVGT